MKTFFAILCSPLSVILHGVIGTALLIYLQDAALLAFKWFIPCLALILADLVSGVHAAHYRGETVKISSALRRTLNKTMCYLVWVIAAVTLTILASSNLYVSVMMGVVVLIEGASFVSNLLEPHGLRLSIRGLLKVVGGKTGAQGLEEVIEKKED